MELEHNDVLYTVEFHQMSRDDTRRFLRGTQLADRVSLATMCTVKSEGRVASQGFSYWARIDEEAARWGQTAFAYSAQRGNKLAFSRALGGLGLEKAERSAWWLVYRLQMAKRERWSQNGKPWPEREARVKEKAG